MSNKRIVLAFLIAPLVPSIYFLMMMEFASKSVIVMMLIYSILFSYVPSLLFGIPFISWLQKKHCLSLVNVVIFGAVAGMIVFYVFRFVFAAMLDSSVSLVPGFSDLIWGALLGVFVSLPFSLIAGIPFSTGRGDKFL